MQQEVLWIETIPVPQLDDEGCGVPFAQIPDLSRSNTPGEVTLGRQDWGCSETPARLYEHFNHLSEEEMGDPHAALDARVRKLGSSYDLIAIGDGPTFGESTVIAVHIADKGAT